jgi:hypothetical protein
MAGIKKYPFRNGICYDELIVGTFSGAASTEPRFQEGL